MLHYIVALHVLVPVMAAVDYILDDCSVFALGDKFKNLVLVDFGGEKAHKHFLCVGCSA
jgi:hypothetical protein